MKAKKTLPPEKTDTHSIEPDILLPKLEEVLSTIPKEQRQIVLATIRQQVDRYSGPLPCAEQVEIYNRCIPNGGDRLMKIVEAQTSARHNLDAKFVEAQIKRDKMGQIFGFIIGVVGITAGAIVACMGHDAVGGLIAGTTVVSLVSAFVLGRRQQG